MGSTTRRVMEMAEEARVVAVYYDGTHVSVEPLDSLKEVPHYIKVHSGAQLWIDVRTKDVPGVLRELDIEDPGFGPIVHEVKEPSNTVMAFTHTVRGSRQLHRTILSAAGPDLLLSIHDSVGETDSKKAMLEYIHTLVEKELAGVPKAILYFRDMLLTALLDSQAEEFIATLQYLIRELSKLHQRLELGEKDTKEVQSELFKMHMFVEDEFPTALLSFRDVVAKLRMGAGKNINLQARHDELEDVLKDVDGAVGIKANVEKTLDLVSASVRLKLTERSIETQRRLQQAVWILTHLSVLLIIPNLVLVFWRLTPWIGDDTVQLGGMEVHSFWMSVILAALFSILALLLLNSFLRRQLGGDIEEAFDETAPLDMR
jgi:hypothetical protein